MYPRVPPSGQKRYVLGKTIASYLRGCWWVPGTYKVSLPLSICSWKLEVCRRLIRFDLPFSFSLASIVIKVSPLQASKCSMKLQWAPEHSSIRTKALYITAARFLQDAPQMSSSSGTISVQTDMMPSIQNLKKLAPFRESINICVRGGQALKKKKPLLYIVQIRLECWSFSCSFLLVGLFVLTSTPGLSCMVFVSLLQTHLLVIAMLKAGNYVVVCGGGASWGNRYERQILASKKQAVSFDISTLCLPSSSSSLLKVAAQRTMVTTVLCPGSFHSLLLLGTQPVLLFPTRCDSSMGIQVLKIWCTLHPRFRFQGLWHSLLTSGGMAHRQTCSQNTHTLRRE